MAHQPTKYTQSNYLWNGNETQKFASVCVCVGHTRSHTHTRTNSIRKKRQFDELFARFWAWGLNLCMFKMPWIQLDVNRSE